MAKATAAEASAVLYHETQCADSFILLPNIHTTGNRLEQLNQLTIFRMYPLQ